MSERVDSVPACVSTADSRLWRDECIPELVAELVAELKKPPVAEHVHHCTGCAATWDEYA